MTQPHPEDRSNQGSGRSARLRSSMIAALQHGSSSGCIKAAFPPQTGPIQPYRAPSEQAQPLQTPDLVIPIFPLLALRLSAVPRHVDTQPLRWRDNIVTRKDLMALIALTTGISLASPGLAAHKPENADHVVNAQGYLNSGNPKASGGPQNPGRGNPHNAY